MKKPIDIDIIDVFTFYASPLPVSKEFERKVNIPAEKRKSVEADDDTIIIGELISSKKTKKHKFKKVEIDQSYRSTPKKAVAEALKKSSITIAGLLQRPAPTPPSASEVKTLQLFLESKAAAKILLQIQAKTEEDIPDVHHSLYATIEDIINRITKKQESLKNLPLPTFANHQNSLDQPTINNNYGNGSSSKTLDDIINLNIQLDSLGKTLCLIRNYYMRDEQEEALLTRLLDALNKGSQPDLNLPFLEEVTTAYLSEKHRNPLSYHKRVNPLKPTCSTHHTPLYT